MSGDDASPATGAAFVTPDGEGEQLHGPVGGPVRWLARAAQTGGAVTALENLVAPQQGPPLHRHDRESELWLVRDGTFRFRLGDDIETVAAGGFVFVPPGIDHCFQNVGDEPARIVVLFTPAGMEGFFEAMAELVAEDITPDTFVRLGAPHGMTVTGPPLSVSHPHPDSA